MQPSLLPPLFERLVSASPNPLVEQALAEGRRALGYTCSFIPEPLLSVDGLLPLRMRAPHTTGTPLADTYLSSVLCPYVRSLLESILELRQTHLSGWVFAVSCDHLRRLSDNLRYLADPSFVQIVDVPHKRDAGAVSYYAEELQQLAHRLEAQFEVDMGPESLRRAAERHNRHLELLGSISELRRRDDPPLSGTDFHTLMVACAISPKDGLAEPLAKLGADLADRTGIGHYRARVLVVGSPLDEPRYLRLIESQGALVVGDRFCVGSLPGLEPIELDDDVFRSLAAHYLVTTRCPRMMDDFDLRVQDILAAAKRFRADGIVIQTMKFCDLWGIEASPLGDELRQAGFPVLRVEREYALSGEGQLRTRIQAFIESMGK